VAKITGLAALGGALVAGGVLIFTWQKYTGLQGPTQNDLNLMLGDAHGVVQSQGTVITSGNTVIDQPATSSWLAHPDCRVPSALGGAATPQHVAQYQADCKTGMDYAAASTALWVTVGALVGIGIVSYAIGSFQAAQAERPRLSILRSRLRVAPVFTGRDGGLQAAFEF
jgi:hypothetical protein